ncbi:amidohydrolase, partial [Klebsiella pneumoniae]
SMQRGVDLHAARNSNHALELLQDAEKLLPEGKSLYGWGWSAARWGAVPDARLLDDAFPQRPVVAINDDKSYCWMNRAAVELYGFTAEECSAEARIALLDEMLSDT